MLEKTENKRKRGKWWPHALRYLTCNWTLTTSTLFSSYAAIIRANSNATPFWPLFNNLQLRAGVELTTLQSKVQPLVCTYLGCTSILVCLTDSKICSSMRSVLFLQAKCVRNCVCVCRGEREREREIVGSEIFKMIRIFFSFFQVKTVSYIYSVSTIYYTCHEQSYKCTGCDFKFRL